MLTECPFECQTCILRFFHFNPPISCTSCDAGIDVDGVYLEACEWCSNQSKPATQALPLWELDDEDMNMLEDVQQSESDKMDDQVWRDMEAWLKTRNKIELKSEVKRDVNGVTFTYYKPFKRYIQDEEMGDFREFIYKIFYDDKQ